MSQCKLLRSRHSGDCLRGYRITAKLFAPFFTEARNSLKSIIDQVNNDAEYTVITRRDAPDAVVMSLDTFNGLMETVHLLKSPANAAHLGRSIEQYRQGTVTPQKLIDA